MEVMEQSEPTFGAAISDSKFDAGDVPVSTDDLCNSGRIGIFTFMLPSDRANDPPRGKLE